MDSNIIKKKNYYNQNHKTFTCAISLQPLDLLVLSTSSTILLECHKAT